MQHIHEVHGQKFVRHGQVEPDEFHAPRAENRFAQMRRIDIKCHVTPIEAKVGEGGILHRGRSRVPDRMAVDGAVACV